MKEQSSLIKKYFLYFNERFPIAGALLYAGTLFYLAYFSASLFSHYYPINIFRSLSGFVVIFLTLLHLRIFDEHKDYEKDKIAHPDRMLSKGFITLKDLRKLLYAVLIIEAGICIFLGFTAFIVWIMIIIWSYLMFAEFFVPEFLNRNMGLYLFSHQIIVPIILFFGLFQRIDIFRILNHEFQLLFLLCIACTASTITYEIARKTWSKEKEHECADSYTRIWGITKTIIINQIMALLSCICFIFIYSLSNFSLTYTIATLIFYLLFLGTEISFIMQPDKKNSKLVEISGIIYLLGVFLTACIGFCLYH